MMDIREELREGSRDRRIPDDPVTPSFFVCVVFCGLVSNRASNRAQPPLFGIEGIGYRV